MQRPFNAGLVGAGGIARAHIAAASQSAGKVAITAVVDIDPDARSRVASSTGALPYESVEQLLADRGRNGVNGLVLCTPPSVRVDPVQQALAEGLAVLIEKPLARRLDEARQVKAIADQHRTIAVGIGYCHRFVPAVVEMKRRLQAGDIGRLVRFENTFASHQTRMSGHWMSDRQVSGGGALIDTGCHSLDLFHFLIGEPAVRSAVLRHEWPGRGESHATLVLTHQASGATAVTGIIQSGWLEPARFDLRLTGTGGSLYYDYNRPTELLLTSSDGGTERIEVESHEVRFRRQLLAFAHLGQGGQEPTNLATVEDGVATAAAVDSAYRAADII